MQARNVVPIRSWNRIRNSGDALNAILVDKLIGAAPFQAAPTAPHLLGAGSILFMANSRSVIWGSGVLNKGAYLPSVDRSQIRALRGRNSADFMTANGIAVGDIPFGDPGIFAAELLGSATAPVGRRYRAAVVPHHDSMDHQFYAAARQHDDVCVVDILNDSLVPIQQISQSDVVLSQSLHGLIYAESLGKPSLWVSFRSDDIWCFKFEDWFTTTENPQLTPVSIDGQLDSIISLAEQRYSTIDKAALMAAFPRELIQSAPQGFLDYDSCRSYSPSYMFVDLERPAGETVGAVFESRDSELMRSKLSEAFHCWAERPYVVLVSGDSERIPTRAQSYTVSRALDARASVECAYIVPKYTSLPDHVRAIPLENDVFLYEDFQVRSGVICVRPTFNEVGDNFIVAAV